MKLDKKTYLHGFTLIVFVLALVRCMFPGVAGEKAADGSVSAADSTSADSVPIVAAAADSAAVRSFKAVAADSTWGRHRINSVPSYRQAFPDSNDVQMASAQKWGVLPVQNREDAESRKKELVYIGSNPYFDVTPLNNSIPYLVPRASVLLQDIGQAFFDSLSAKGVPLHRILVSSVLRTKDDVAKLRRRNSNATENSCHQYGTTFDIPYNRYAVVYDPAGEPKKMVRNDTLKWVLSEVLDDMRKSGRCYIKYEVKQGCFHITTR